MEIPSSLQLDELFFPLQDVRANPLHDQQGDRTGTVINFAQQVQKIEGQPGRYAVSLAVNSDNENSKNPPYTFSIEAYAVITLRDAIVDAATEPAVVLAAGMPVLVGALRERVAELTSRAPWGRFLINLVPVQLPMPVVPR